MFDPSWPTLWPRGCQRAAHRGEAGVSSGVVPVSPRVFLSPCFSRCKHSIVPYFRHFRHFSWWFTRCFWNRRVRVTSMHLWLAQSGRVRTLTCHVFSVGAWGSGLSHGSRLGTRRGLAAPGSDTPKGLGGSFASRTKTSNLRSSKRESLRAADQEERMGIGRVLGTEGSAADRAVLKADTRETLRIRH